MKLLRESLVMDPEIIDNFLPSSQFEKIQSYMIGDGNFPWFYNNGIVDEDDGLSQLIHLFYHPKGTISRCYSLILPILTKLRVSDIYKIKANLIPRTAFRRKTRYHIDGDGLWKWKKTAILYLNTTNGYTSFKGYRNVKTVANRMVIFPNEMEHRAVTCTNKKVRSVINFNYE